VTDIKILIADDEELARQRLKLLIDKAVVTLNVSVTCVFAEDGASAIEMIHSEQPNIVFLDVQMPEVDGINVALNFPQRDFSLIFQTAHADYAIKAFEMSATDYLLKPYSSDRLLQALKKALNEQQNLRVNSKETGEKLIADPLASALSSENIFLEHIAVKAGSRIRFVPVEEIKYFLSTDHMTQLFTAETDFACDPSLGTLEERLPPKEFLRIHRNAIVRLKEIVTFQQEGNATVTLKSGVELKVSRERKKILKDVMGI
jgi:two-component system, LytTR family, response regulator